MIELTYDDVFSYESLYSAHMRGRLDKSDNKPLVQFEMEMTSKIYRVYINLNEG